MNLFEAYDKDITKGKITNDPQQRATIVYFQELLEALEQSKKSWYFWRRKKIQGIYIYGSVGVGKTYLMDLFYQNIHISTGKIRLHFHHFMQTIDKKLRDLQGKKNPLQLIARQLATQIQLLCLDEMLVNDVAHAMILRELLTYLFAEGIILVTTSNTAPDDLYQDGVQQQRFKQAINALKSHCTLVHLNTNYDFRLNNIAAYQTYISPLNSHAEAILASQFHHLSPSLSEKKGEIFIQNRFIPFLKRSETVIWFDFNALCNIPRSQLDYLELSDLFSTIIVSNVPVLDMVDSAEAVLFVCFIDVLYDKKIRLMLSAAVSLEQLFGNAKNNFQRTYSRLQEMQSIKYS